MITAQPHTGQSCRPLARQKPRDGGHGGGRARVCRAGNAGAESPGCLLSCDPSFLWSGWQSHARPQCTQGSPSLFPARYGETRPALLYHHAGGSRLHPLQETLWQECNKFHFGKNVTSFTNTHLAIPAHFWKIQPLPAAFLGTHLAGGGEKQMKLH